MSYRDTDSKLFMPNEVFKDLVSCKDYSKDASSHIAFAYSYIYLCTWLYRHCNYFQMEKVTQERLKEILGYTSSYKGLDYIIKKNGLLEKLGYLETTTDYPLSWNLDEDRFLEFETIKEFEKKYGYGVIPNTISRNFKVKLPIKAFHRTKESLEERDLDGTFYDVYHTHMIPVEVFIYCMANVEIGVIGLYLYAFIKHMNGIYSDSVDISLKQFVVQTGIKGTTLDTYLKRMKEQNIIECDPKPYVFDLPEYLREANTYKVVEYQHFGQRLTPVENRKVMSLYTYKKENGIVVEKQSYEPENNFLSMVDMDDSLLPY